MVITLMTMFMAGLALGAAALDRLAAGRTPPAFVGALAVLAFAGLSHSKRNYTHFAS
mgnify:CR=1 FL=1